MIPLGAFFAVLCASLGGAQSVLPSPAVQQGITTPAPTYSKELHSGLSEQIGNFSVEILYHTTKSQKSTQNLIISPMTIWTVLAVVTEGASGRTESEIKKAARIGDREPTRQQFAKILKYLTVNTSTVQLARVNTIYLDHSTQLEQDFKIDVYKHYSTLVQEVNFSEKEKTAQLINQQISQFTHGRIKKLVDSSYFDNTKMIMTSALYFKGQWSSPFNASSTEKLPFYNSEGKVIGEVNMMYNRFTYPFANIRNLQARVIELPYGIENRLSMLVMLPNANVTLDSMFHNIANYTLDKVFTELQISKDEFSDDEVDCFLPRFKIESDLQLNEALMDMGIFDMFDEQRADLIKMVREPTFVSRVVHKAEIEVTEEGTEASAVTSAEFANRIGIVRFEANRPFAYMIIEKVTNSIVFGGLYQQPSLY